MKSILVVAAVLLGSSALASAHTSRPSDVRAYTSDAARPAVGGWRFNLPRPYDGAGQTLTGGPSGGPNQS